MNTKNKLYFSLIIFSLSFSALSQTCVPAMSESTPSADFTINNNGTVTHKKTNLMWKVCSQGQTWAASNCRGTLISHTWDKALQTPETINTTGGYAGFSDWRLPNIKELLTIVELKCLSPAVNTAIFFATPNKSYWSSSPLANVSDSAWFVDFAQGYDSFNSRTANNYVRLVRDAP